MNPNLIQSLASPYIWRGRDAVSPPQTLACGFEPLERLLVGGGWAVGATTEVLMTQPGIGEMQLLMPALQGLHPPSVQTQQWIALVQPPYLPHLPAWMALGLNPQRLLWLRIPALAQRLWAMEQLLRSGSCGAVLGWLPETAVRDRDIRRLQHAAASGNCVHVSLRPKAVADTTSAAACRLLLTSERRGLTVQMLKQRGQWGGRQCRLQLRSHHQTISPLPRWQWPLPRANQQATDATTESPIADSLWPLIESVSSEKPP